MRSFPDGSAKLTPGCRTNNCSPVLRKVGKIGVAEEDGKVLGVPAGPLLAPVLGLYLIWVIEIVRGFIYRHWLDIPCVMLYIAAMAFAIRRRGSRVSRVIVIVMAVLYAFGILGWSVIVRQLPYVRLSDWADFALMILVPLALTTYTAVLLKPVRNWG